MTKEDFWNDIKEKYPTSFKRFGEWIDIYKGQNNWINLFRIEQTKHTIQNDEYGKLEGIYIDIDPKTFTPKYHDLPIAMQLGIFLEYIYERDPSSRYFLLQHWLIKDFDTDVKQLIQDSFKLWEGKWNDNI